MFGGEISRHSNPPYSGGPAESACAIQLQLLQLISGPSVLEGPPSFHDEPRTKVEPLSVSSSPDSHQGQLPRLLRGLQQGQ